VVHVSGCSARDSWRRSYFGDTSHSASCELVLERQRLLCGRHLDCIAESSSNFTKLKSGYVVRAAEWDWYWNKG